LNKSFETESTSWNGRMIDREIFEVLRNWHKARVNNQEPVVWEITVMDIKRSLPVNITAVSSITVRRSLKRLEKSGYIKLHDLGYNRTGYSLRRFA